MGVNRFLARCAVRRAHVLLVEAPGSWVLRVAAQRRVLDRGWRLSATPADADVLLVCRAPRPELAELVGRVWNQLPGPRVRIEIEDVAQIDEALESAAAQLVEMGQHRDDRLSRATSPGDGAHGEHSLRLRDEAMAHGSRDGMEHEGSEDAHEGHEGMDHAGHGGMEMAPHGIPLAAGGEDRDGLEMDVMHLAFGPVLQFWPAGLVLQCALQGDVVVDATAALLDAGGDPDERAEGEPAGVRAARLVDHAADVLALAGWQDAASSAHRVRDQLLDGSGAEAALGQLRRRVAGSWLLRWSLRDTGRLDHRVVERHDLPAWLAGDAHHRLLVMLDGALSEWPQGRDAPETDAAGSVVQALPHLVWGRELAEVRLLVASLALDATSVAVRARHG